MRITSSPCAHHKLYFSESHAILLTVDNNSLVNNESLSIMISDDEIEEAKKKHRYTADEPLHEHNDCIRMAYEWLDAQMKIKGITNRTWPVKHLVERWAGRYVSTSDVEVAASMHPDIRGEYPHFNISSRLTEPSQNRLIGISEAFKHSSSKKNDSSVYKVHE